MNDIEDRKRGVMAGLAVGDALGAGYEFGPALPKNTNIYMKGGGVFQWEPGEWTDDTSMAIPIAEAVAEGKNLESLATLERIYQDWRQWARSAPDVGNQTRTILGLAENSARATMLSQSAGYIEAGGNGCVMRTAPLALGCLDDETKCRSLAKRYARLTHGHPRAVASAAWWTQAIATAVVTGWFPPGILSSQLNPLDYTETNGSAWDAVYAAIGCIAQGQGDFQKSLEIAVRSGGDTDTVAAIAGGLLGAVHGLSGIPREWIYLVHGWPGLTLLELPTVRS